MKYVLVVLLSFSATLIGAPVHGYRIVATYPHSIDNYTEGFFYLGGLFYEGTGLNGHSAVVVSVPETGKILQTIRLPAQYFGEGIVDWGPYLYEWTWKAQVCFVYDRFSLQLVKQLSYTGEGRGMTHNAKEIITSDGSATLRFRNPETFQEIHEIHVHENHRAIDQLNELEYIKGQIYANIWHSDRIARISPGTGEVLDWIDLSGILPPEKKVNEESVLNGIAYDPEHDRLFVTGKQWPFVFEIKIVP